VNPYGVRLMSVATVFRPQAVRVENGHIGKNRTCSREEKHYEP